MKNKQHSKFKKIIIDHLRTVKGSLFAAALCMIGFTLAEVLTPWPLKIIFDYILIGREVPDHLFFLDFILDKGRFFSLIVIAGSILLIALLRGLFAYFQIFITSRIGFQLVYNLRLELFAHLQTLSLSFHSRTRSGELLTKVTGDTKMLRDIYSESVLTFVSHFMTIIGVFAVMFFVSWKLSLIALIPFPILIYTLFYLFRKIKKTAKKQRKKEGKVTSRINELLSIIPLVQSYSQETYENERFEAESVGTLKESIRIARMVAATTRMVEIISASGVFIVVFFGSLQVIDGSLTPGDLLLFSAYVKKLFNPVKRISKLSTKFSKAMASADRIEDLLETEPEIQDAPDAIVVKKLKGEIEFKNVSFSYDDGKTILKKVSFKVLPGQRVALVGGSGAGKSTLTKLLLRLYDFQEGEILVDGINIKKFKRDSLRREIGIVLQEAILLGTTIRENITYGKPGATQEEIEAAAHYAHADEFIKLLPDRYETILGERGGTLSGGQRQRIGLARAIILKPSFLILDEPTSAVDAESAKFIQEAMAQFQKGKTCLVIIHQFEAIQDFDQIIALKNGQVIEKGTHQELLERKGYYEELYRLQGAL
ncbi:MAG: ABC transporter ATP-binding protein [Nitrospiria bacterium]